MFVQVDTGTIFFILFAALCVIIAAVIVYLLYIYRQYSHLPSPKGAGFFTGHTSLLSAAINGDGYFDDIFVKWANECGPVYVLWVIFKPIVVVAHPDIVKQLATSKHSKPKSDPNIWNRQRFLGNGILSIQHHRESIERRRIYDPSFTKTFLNGLVPQYNRIVQTHLVDYLRGVADGQTAVDMKQLIGKVTLAVINEVAFGINFKEDKYVQSICAGSSQNIMSLVETSLEGVTVQELNPLLPYIKPHAGKKYIDAAAKLREIGRYCINKRIKLIENKEECPQDILTQIIILSQKDDSKLGFEDLVDDFITFYIAGQETSANSILFTLVELLQQPDLYQRCHSEVDEVLNGSEVINVGHLDKLEFLHAALEESLRLHPVGTLIEKIANEEIITNDYKIPKKTSVWMSSYVSQRNPEYFDNPLQFDPSRFEPGQKRPSPYVYFPFGIGHRICIGRAFSMIESKVILALLLKNFKFSLSEGYKMKKVFRGGVAKPADVTCYVELNN